MNARDLIYLITEVSISLHLDPNLSLAIAARETSFCHLKTRFEPAWDYFLDPPKYASHLGITEKTEKIHQATSFGPLQIMGACARELGFSDYLVSLIDPHLSVPLSCQKLARLQEKHSDLSDVISSYNQGAPRKKNGIYLNSEYVNDILKRIARFKESV